MSGFGPSRQFAALQQHVGNWSNSGHPRTSASGHSCSEQTLGENLIDTGHLKAYRIPHYCSGLAIAG
jgi:hypothetical protein